MKSKGQPFDEVYGDVLQNHPIACPNSGFMECSPFFPVLISRQLRLFQDVTLNISNAAAKVRFLRAAHTLSTCYEQIEFLTSQCSHSRCKVVQLHSFVSIVVPCWRPPLIFCTHGTLKVRSPSRVHFCNLSVFLACH
jgi:hypothetical protein